MTISLYVGNLPYNTKESELWSVFSRLGEVESITLITDRQTGLPRGFGFVTMERVAGHRAMEELTGANFGGRPLVIREAKSIHPRFANAQAQARDGSARFHEYGLGFSGCELDQD
ncbi:MAG: RNA-binding protein [Deltaproteobacteria bacterium]|nr:RNA-binding protein [Deltaproteobacteria bacterium]